jgi:N-acetylmuramoyl-L-alanine amidase
MRTGNAEGRGATVADKRILVMGACLLVGVFFAGCVVPVATGRKAEEGQIEAEYVDVSEGGELSEALTGDLNLEKIDTKSHTIVIDSGHGGIDPGKTNGDVQEKDINLSIALKLEKVLQQLGYNTVMTRTADEGLYSDNDTNKKRADLKKRCDMANSADADMMVSIHQNSFTSATVSGAQVFYYTYSAKGKKLAEILQKSFKNNLDSENSRTPKEDKSYYLLIHSKIPTVIVECGFLTNKAELVLLQSEDYQMKIVEAVALGINEYLAAFTNEGAAP